MTTTPMTTTTPMAKPLYGKNVHLVLSADDINRIVNALSFYLDYHTNELTHEPDSLEQYRLAFKEDNLGFSEHGSVDRLATHIATAK